MSTAELLEVSLKERSYPVHFGRGISALIREGISTKQLALITSEGVQLAQGQFIEELFPEVPRLVLPSGEQTKSLESARQCYEFLIEHGVNRNASLIALGGGVVGDLVGFVAATYLRGISFYNIPTTLLAMVDSSIGGKTGVNLLQGKNLVGAFHQPKAVFIDTKFLETLPAREFASGMAEVIKYGLLADVLLLERLESEMVTPRSSQLEIVIRRCCELKGSIVTEDEYDSAKNARRALLNLGHTFAHAIESVAGYGEYLHGEAVAIGLLLAARLSRALGKLNSADVARVERLLESYELPTKLRGSLPLQELIEAMQRDKKARSGEIRFVILNALGEAVLEDLSDLNIINNLWRTVGAQAS